MFARFRRSETRAVRISAALRRPPRRRWRRPARAHAARVLSGPTAAVASALCYLACMQQCSELADIFFRSRRDCIDVALQLRGKQPYQTASESENARDGRDLR